MRNEKKETVAFFMSSIDSRAFCKVRCTDARLSIACSCDKAQLGATKVSYAKRLCKRVAMRTSFVKTLSPLLVAGCVHQAPNSGGGLDF